MRAIRALRVVGLAIVTLAATALCIALFAFSDEPLRYVKALLVEMGLGGRITIHQPRFPVADDGPIAIEADAISGRIDLHAALFDRRIELRDVVITRPKLRLELPIPPTSPTEPQARGGLDLDSIPIRVRKLQIVDGSLTIVRADGSREEIDRVNGDLDLVIAHGATHVALRGATARWVGRDRSIAAGGWLALGRDGLVAAAAKLETPDARASALIAHAGDGRPWSLIAEGSAFGADLDVTLNATSDLASVDGIVGFERVDPRALDPAAPSGNLRGKAVVALRREPWRATATVIASGDLGADRIEGSSAALGVVWQGAIGPRDLAADVSIDVTGTVGHVEAKGGVRRVGEQPFELADVRVAGRVAAIERWLPMLKIAGTADVDVRLRGPIDDFSLEGTVSMPRGIRLGAVRARSARADLVLRGLPRKPVGTVTWRATRLSLPGAIIDSARGRIELRDDGRLAFDKVRIDTAAGAVFASGEADAKRPLEDFRARVRVVRFDLGRAQKTWIPATRADVPLEGKLTASASIARRGRWLSADATGDVSGFRWDPSLDTVELRDLRATLAKSRIEANVIVARDDRQRLELAIEGRAPRDPTNPRAWLALRADDVTRLHAEILELDAAWIQRIASLPHEVDGRIDGSIDLVEAPRRLAFQIKGSDLARPNGEMGGIQATIRGALAGRQITVDRLLATRRGKPLVDAHGRIDRGLADLVERKQRAFEGARVVATVDVTDLAIAELELVPPEVDGRLTAHVELDSPLDAPAGTVRASVRAPRAFGLELTSVTVAGALETRALHEGRRAHRFDGDVVATRRGAGRVEVSGVFDDSDLSFEGDVRATELDLASLRAFAPSPDHPLADVTGRVDAHARLAGTIFRPSGELSATLTGGRVLLEDGWQTLDRLEVHASLADGKGVVDKLDARFGRGMLGAHGTFLFDGPIPMSADLALVARHVPIPIRGVPTDVVLNGRVRGKREGSTFALTAEVTHGSVKLPDGLRAGLQSLKPLDDVVFVDGREPDRARDAAASALDETLRTLGFSRAKVFTLAIDLGRGVTVQNADVSVVIVDEGDLALTLSGRRLALEGTLSVKADTGAAILYGRQYAILRGVVRLDGRMPPNPDIELVLVHEFRNAAVYIEVYGTVDRPVFELWSQPADYDDAQILGFILGGEPDDEATLGDLPVEAKAAGLASQLIADQIRRIVSQLSIPLDVLRLRPGEDGTPAGGGFDTGWWFTRNLFAGYRYRPTVDDRENVHELQVQYELMRRLIFDARAGDSGVISGDLLFVHRW